jgi:hypothetical protein
VIGSSVSQEMWRGPLTVAHTCKPSYARGPLTVAHTCKPSYARGSDRRITSHRPISTIQWAQILKWKKWKAGERRGGPQFSGECVPSMYEVPGLTPSTSLRNWGGAGTRKNGGREQVGKKGRERGGRARGEGVGAKKGKNCLKLPAGERGTWRSSGAWSCWLLGFGQVANCGRPFLPWTICSLWNTLLWHNS